MGTMFLDSEEIQEMTDRKTRVAQRRMLNSLGTVYRIRADGGLLGLRAHVERELPNMTCGRSAPAMQQP